MTSWIAAENLWKSYGRKTAVAGLSFSVGPGQVVALLGRNGAGKSTTLKMLTGQANPDAGRALLFDEDSLQVAPEVRRRVAYMAEGNFLDPWAGVRNVIAFTRSFYPAWNREGERNLLKRFGLDPAQRVKSLSNGERGRLALLLAVCQSPDALLLDDPMLGLDAGVRRDFFRIIAETLSDRPRAVLFTSHIMEDVERVADRVIIMRGGHAIASGSIGYLSRIVRKFQVRLREGAAFPEDHPGVLETRPEGRGWEVVATSTEALRALEPELLEEAGPLPLEDIFLALTNPGANFGEKSR